MTKPKPSMWDALSYVGVDRFWPPRRWRWWHRWRDFGDDY